MKKFIVFIISLNLLGSEFKKMDDNFTRKIDLKYEEFILKNVNHKDFITISETLGNIIIFFNQEKEINKIVYFNKNNKIKRDINISFFIVLFHILLFFYNFYLL